MQLSGPRSLPPSLPGPPNWAPPPQLRPTIPRHLCSRQGRSVMEALGPQEAGVVQATLSQTCCCSRSTGLASGLPPVSAAGLLPCLLDPHHFLREQAFGVDSAVLALG